MQEFNASGYLTIQDESINGPLSPVNRKYVDDAVESALRIDTSVGTRVFAGDVMIYGDTGLRQANDLAAGFDFSTAAHHGMTLQRVGNKVTLEGLGVRSTAEIWMTQTLPSGFRPRNGEFRSNRGFAQIGGTVYPIGNHSTLLRMATVSKTLDVGAVVNFKAEWNTNDSWPASLLGIPI